MSIEGLGPTASPASNSRIDVENDAAPAAAQPPVRDAAPANEPAARSRPSDDDVRGARVLALAEERSAAARVAMAAPGADRAEAAAPVAAGAPPADLVDRLDALDTSARSAAFASSPEAARAFVVQAAGALPHVDDVTRRELLRPMEQFAVDSLRAGRNDETVRALAPLLGTRAIDAAALAARETTPAGRAATATLLQVAGSSTDPAHARHAATAALNVPGLVDSALRGTHAQVSRAQLAQLALTDPARTNQVLDAASQVGPEAERAMREAGLSRQTLPALTGVAAGVADVVEGAAGAITHPLRTAQGLATLAAAAITDPMGTGYALGQQAAQALRDDPARALTAAALSVLPIGGAVSRLGRVERLVPEATPSRAPDATSPGARVASGLGDLSTQEVRAIQNVVEEAQARLNRVLAEADLPPGAVPVDIVVVGSAAQGARRGAGTSLPFGKGPGTRSDIDYAVPNPIVSERVFDTSWLSRPEQALQRQLPEFDTRTVGGMLHHGAPATDVPRIWFRSGQPPVFLRPGQPNLPIVQ